MSAGRVLLVALVGAVVAVGVMRQRGTVPQRPTAEAPADARRQAAQAQQERDSARRDDVASCDEREYFVGFRDKVVLDGRLRYAWNMKGAPENMHAAELQRLLGIAAAAWNRCGLTLQLAGETTQERGEGDLIVVGWKGREAFQASFGGLHASGSYFWDGSGGSIYLNADRVDELRSRFGHDVAQRVLQETLSHELGHSIGLIDHSPRCVDVMSTAALEDGCAAKATQGDEVRLGDGRVAQIQKSALPTGCDIQRCKRLYLFQETAR